jgi:precorrin-2 dehydrogenase / sirohydrochlorin ferrochelatase
VQSLLPIVLNPAVVRIGVAGAGDGLKRRLQVVERAGVHAPSVFDGKIPSDEDLATLSVLFVAGLAPGPSGALAAAARARGVLVNVEDRPALCDFHVAASVRRGDLLLTVSTGGRSPGLARLVREELEQRFGPEWEGRVEEVARTRAVLRDTGVDPGTVSERTRALVRERGWLP